ncbi:sigma-70 family RNA polymerase sigma factor [Verrucomicrobiales bacterium BCK34]|nr:sigma-70 family RNA polymerase sigma factor [Verrucomicrobiales bacterium BCK34]
MSDQPDNHERFISLLTKHERVIRASIGAVIRRPEDVDEIMQNVSLVAWRKFETLTDLDGFAKWACVIARYEIMAFQRNKARDRFELNEALIEKITAEAATEIPVTNRRLQLLDSCLQKLPRERRSLVMTAYEPGLKTMDLAEKLGKSVDGLYQLLRRIRLELKECVDRELAQETREGSAL